MKRKSQRRSSPALPGQLDMFAGVAGLAEPPKAPASLTLPPPLRRTTSKESPLKTPTAAPKAKVPSTILRVHDAAARIGVSASILNKMRCDGRGPRFIKLTGKIVGYAVEDLDAWVASRRENAGAYARRS